MTRECLTSNHTGPVTKSFIRKQGEALKKIRLLGFLAVMIMATTSPVKAAVRMPGFFNDNMVLQRDMDVPIWGWADSAESVTVEFAGQKLTAKAGAGDHFKTSDPGGQ